VALVFLVPLAHLTANAVLASASMESAVTPPVRGFVRLVLPQKKGRGRVERAVLSSLNSILTTNAKIPLEATSTPSAPSEVSATGLEPATPRWASSALLLPALLP
jgi:hypothetical protein